MTTLNSNPQANALCQKLISQNEAIWIQIGSLAELQSDFERATKAYDCALRHNPYSFSALYKIATLCRGREQYDKAIDYFQRALNIDNTNGDVWGALGHCYLMMDDLTKAYSSYQQALYNLPNPKDPKLWYGIGILYDRYSSLEHAEEAFSAVMRMDPKFDKGNEIYFRLGIIYKQQLKFELSLQCFRYILTAPPRPLTEVDIWFQIGHVYEQQKEFVLAKEAYERVLNENPSHAKVLQQLGWLYHQQNAPYSDQEQAISYLKLSLEADSGDAQSFYLLGRCYMTQNNYNKAYEAYQQAVYRDGRNPTFWCSIGVLYYQINQFRDALDAYSRAIRLNPQISEVWYDLGTLYESCNNQIEDARDAYTRALELDPNNSLIKARLAYLNGGQSGSSASIPQEPNGQFNQGPLGPPPGVQSFPTRNENQSTLPAPLSFTQFSTDRAPGAMPAHLAPMSHSNKMPSPITRNNHLLNFPPEDPGRIEPGSIPRPSILDPRAPSPSQNQYARQHARRPDYINGLNGDGRKMSIPSPGINGLQNGFNPASRSSIAPSANSRGPNHEGSYYRPEHNDRREFEDSYKQRNPVIDNPSRHESHVYGADRHGLERAPAPDSRYAHGYSNGYPVDPRRNSLSRPVYQNIPPPERISHPEDRYQYPDRPPYEDKLRAHTIRSGDPRNHDRGDYRIDPRLDTRPDLGAPRNDFRGDFRSDLRDPRADFRRDSRPELRDSRPDFRPDSRSDFRDYRSELRGEHRPPPRYVDEDYDGMPDHATNTSEALYRPNKHIASSAALPFSNSASQLPNPIPSTSQTPILNESSVPHSYPLVQRATPLASPKTHTVNHSITEHLESNPKSPNQSSTQAS